MENKKLVINIGNASVKIKGDTMFIRSDKKDLIKYEKSEADEIEQKKLKHSRKELTFNLEDYHGIKIKLSMGDIAIKRLILPLDKSIKIEAAMSSLEIYKSTIFGSLIFENVFGKIMVDEETRFCTDKVEGTLKRIGSVGQRRVNKAASYNRKLEETNSGSPSLWLYLSGMDGEGNLE